MAWYEIAAEGDAGAWERLLAEQEAGAGERAVRGPEVPLRPGSGGEHLPGLLDAGSRHLAFVPGELAKRLAAALTAKPAIPPGLRLARLREVTGGHFDFSVEAFSEPAAQEIRAVLGTPAPGVEVRLTRDEEQREPKAGKPGAVELYAPVHCYAYRAWGTVTGPFPGVLDLHRRLHPLPFVYEKKLELVAHQLDPADLPRRLGGGPPPTAARPGGGVEMWRGGVGKASRFRPFRVPGRR